MANHKTHKPCASKDTFWNRKRVEKNVHIKDLADVIGCGASTLGSLFSGQLVPREETMKQLCILLDVDPIEGMREAIKASKEWDTQRGTRYKMNIKPQSRLEDVATPESSTIVEPTVEVKDTKPVTETPKAVRREKAPKSFLESIYSIVTYDDFNAILEGNMSSTEALKYLYDKVDFDTFMKIYRKEDN